MRTLRELALILFLFLSLCACQSPKTAKKDEGKRPVLHPRSPSKQNQRACVHCHQKIDGSYVVFDKNSYHKECYLRVAPKCGICQRAIFGSAVTLGDRFSYHAPCFAKSRRCDACSLPTAGSPGGGRTLPDGRIQCGRCQQTAVEELAEARSLFSMAVLELHRKLGIDLRTIPVELKLADRQTMSRLAENHATIVKGFMVAGRKDVKIGGKVYQGPWKFTIWVLRSLPKEAALGVMVHELFHVWQVQNCPVQSAVLREGSANYAQWLVLCQRRQWLWASLIEMDPDPTYGEGFRRFRKWLGSEDQWTAALAKLRKMKDLPASN